jgi:hypothetical protein
MAKKVMHGVRNWQYTLSVIHEDDTSGVMNYKVSAAWSDVLADAHKILMENPRWSCEIAIVDKDRWYDN